MQTGSEKIAACWLFAVACGEICLTAQGVAVQIGGKVGTHVCPDFSHQRGIRAEGVAGGVRGDDAPGFVPQGMASSNFLSVSGTEEIISRGSTFL